jgi:hypothetical protein
MIRLGILWLASRMFGWQLGTGGAQIGTAAPSAVTPEQAAAAGAGPKASPEQHVHSSVAVAPPIVLGAAAAEGAAATFVRSDATIAAFDATVPVVQAYADAAATGAAAVAARRDHRHGMPAATRLLGITVFNGGGTFNTPAGTNALMVEGLGGGGGGAGAAQTATNAGAGGGGAAGGYSLVYIGVPAASYAVTIGAAGAAGAAGDNPGGDGGQTSFGAVLTIPGGAGGPPGGTGAAIAITDGGGAGAVPTGGDVNTRGTPGGWGVRVPNKGGDGASSQYGGGGIGGMNAAGQAGSGSGSGGGGASTAAVTVNRAGGAGTAGLILVYRYG